MTETKDKELLNEELEELTEAEKESVEGGATMKTRTQRIHPEGSCRICAKNGKVTGRYRDL